VLTDDSGPIDLSAAVTITLVLTHRKTRSRETYAMTIVAPPTNGRVTKLWAATEPSTTGDFDAEIVIDFGSGQVLAVPTEGNFLYRIDTLD
jgi:hypothetical protein